MSRSGYSDDYDDQWGLIMWRGQVASAIRGKRGQAFLMELLDALEAMPERRLVADVLKEPDPIAIVDADGRVVDVHPQVCALGALGVRRGVDMDALNPENYDQIAEIFGVSHQLVQELEFENDEFGDYYGHRTPEQRWQHMHDWAMRQIRPVRVEDK